jgi:hypothetical protein
VTLLEQLSDEGRQHAERIGAMFDTPERFGELFSSPIVISPNRIWTPSGNPRALT